MVVLWIATAEVGAAQLHYILSLKPDLQETGTGIDHLWVQLEVKSMEQGLCHFLGTIHAIFFIDPVLSYPEEFVSPQLLYEVLNNSGAGALQAVEGFVGLVRDVVLWKSKNRSQASVINNQGCLHGGYCLRAHHGPALSLVKSLVPPPLP